LVILVFVWAVAQDESLYIISLEIDFLSSRTCASDVDAIIKS
jgi:hypothetical protein